jgi:hypothetical protein
MKAAEPGARRLPVLWLQVVAMFLAALLPVAWLIGRRTAPAVRILPLIARTDDEGITLQETPRGLAGSASPVRLPAPADRGATYRLRFLLGSRDDPARPPYRMRLEGPDGGDIWQTRWDAAAGDRLPLELMLPAAILRPGRHALRVEDGAGIVRSYPFIVP